MTHLELPPDAIVTARNVDTGLTQTARTGADGVYSIVYLPVGSYTVATEKAGFRKAEAMNVRVAVNTVVSVDVKLLEIGQFQEAIRRGEPRQ